MELNERVTRIALAALLVLGFGAFVALATDFGDNFNNHQEKKTVAAINTSTTNETFLPFDSTTTTFPIVTTTIPVVTTTPAVTTTPTTKKTTTATTKKPTTTTTAPNRPTGTRTEAADNPGATFTADASGHPSGAAPPACNPADVFCFDIGVSGGQLTITLVNNTTRAIAFPGNLSIKVKVTNPDNSTTEFSVDPTINGAPVSTIAAKSKLDVTTSETFPAGSYSFTASCAVDYGS